MHCSFGRRSAFLNSNPPKKIVENSRRTVDNELKEYISSIWLTQLQIHLSDRRGRSLKFLLPAQCNAYPTFKNIKVKLE
jgi:hypothetical protein